jgi:NDP-sugar pyrophosphorylase family protein
VHRRYECMAAYVKSVILAGGRGKRLRTLGQILPKCLLPVFDKPLLIHQIEQCAQAGVSEVLVSTSALFEASVRFALSQYAPPPALTVTCVAEPEPLGPILGLLSVVPWLEGKAALVLLGDEYYEDSSPFRSLADRAAVPDLLLGVVHNSAPQRILCNVVMDEAGRILSLREKPAFDQLAGYTRWCGFTGFRAGILEDVPRAAVEHYAHLGDLLSFLIARGSLPEALDFREIHLNLNTADDALIASLVEARRQYRQGGHPLLKSIEDTIEPLLLAAGFSRTVF